jgi:acyl-CoA synthetase (NDP forming)
LKTTLNLDRLFNPTTLAIIGASNDDRKSGGQFLNGLMHSAFKGKLYAVNPNEPVIFGLKSYRSVTDIPGVVDLAIIAVPARIVPQVMAECSRKGVRFAIVHSAGFSELGAEGKELEKEMIEFAQQSGTRIIGPNCMGLYSPKAHINTIASRTLAFDEPGSVAFVGQSGWVTENVIQLGYERGVCFSKVVSIGNQSDLTIEDMIEYFGADAQTKVIAFYAEGIKHGKRFLEVASKVSKKKPIIAWKGGRSEVGTRAAASHTGSLAGNSAIIDAVFTQGGVVKAHDLHELIDLIVGFTSPLLPTGNKVGLLVEAGGGAVGGSDAAESFGLKVPTLSAQAQKELVETLKTVIPPFSSPKNPVDIVWAPAESATQLFMKCARVMLNEVDALVTLNYELYDDDCVKEMTELRDKVEKPIFVIPGHAAERRTGMALLTKNGIPTFHIPERAMKTLAAMLRYVNYRRQNQRRK